MESLYRKATLALSLPFSCDMEIFPNQKSIPLIARTSSPDKIAARRRFGLPATAIVVLISFGGFGLERIRWERLKQMEDFFFVTTGPAFKAGKNILILPDAQPHYEDLVRAGDVVVSKPGYEIVAEIIAHRVRLLYNSRGNFPGYPFLVEMLNHRATSEFISQEELLRGDVRPYLRKLLEKKPNWPEVPLNGAEAAAEKILGLLSSFPPGGRS